MSQVTPQIWIGGFLSARNGRWLQDRGVTHIVNASKELPDYFPQNFKYLRLDLNDSSDQDLTKALSNSYRFMKKAIDEGGVVFVHCFAGISRSSSQIIHYLMMDRVMSFERALDYVSRKHPRTNPNDGFRNQLLLKDPTKRSRFTAYGSRYDRSYPVIHQGSWWSPW
uniref:Dual specificity phosphatase n=1 Tax=Marseillevirus LCMAC101 TaxID=2506602 RepID=A0A481YRR1_9VIRU|nr:MAG: dual specificity phosphatase [Marseillevirus LCMAC101]